jgi:hypothetical protein
MPSIYIGLNCTSIFNLLSRANSQMTYTYAMKPKAASDNQHMEVIAWKITEIDVEWHWYIFGYQS